MNEHFESKERIRGPEGYFSVSHLVHRVHVRFEDGHVESHSIAVAGKVKDGKKKFQAFGGGAKLTEKGIGHLTDTFGEKVRFREGEESDDARFYVELPEDEDEYDMFARETLTPFVQIEDGLIETSIEREFREEIVESAPTVAPLLPAQLESTYVGVVSPLDWSEPGSSRSDGAVLYRRVFHLFDITITPEQYAALSHSENVRILSASDIAAVTEAAAEGRALAETSDGAYIVENVFPVVDEVKAK